MTRPLEVELEARSKAKTFAQAIVIGLERDDAAKPSIVWPSDKYATDPVGFAREILGVEPWERQIEILEAVVTFWRIAVSSGHKVGKSNCAAIIALWFFCSFPRARVVMTSTTSRQVDEILWREVSILHDAAKKRGTPIGGDLKILARSGLTSRADFREVKGFTAREAEGVAGVSAANLMYIVDEASGIDDSIFEAIEGNRAGGARIILFSNPTRTEGEHYEACEGSKKDLYKVIHVSSEETPNVVSGENTIPGLAGREWIEEKKKEWGEESAIYSIRAKGRHALRDEGKIISVHDIMQAEARWHGTAYEGRLHIGVDPAGPSGAGDESAFACRRGKKIGRLYAKRGLDEDAHLAEILGLCQIEGRPDDKEKPILCVDRDGYVGAKLWGVLLSYMLAHEKNNDAAFELFGMRSSERAKRSPQEFFLLRDELYFVFATWLREEGAIPEDAKLSADLRAPSWEYDPENRAHATSKKVLIKLLGRSPDRGDACMLSVWTPNDYEHVAKQTDAAQRRANQREARERVPTLDPYDSGDAWRTRR